jgi:hypothetical protein
VFTDEGQRVFDRHGSPPVPLVPLVLDHNLRNTRQIANAFQPLVDLPMRFLGGEGPAVRFVVCTRQDAMDAGDDEVERLLEQGWRPEDVALLTTGTRHPEQKERQAAGNAAYWDSFWDADQVFYGHVSDSRASNAARSCWLSTRSQRLTARGNASTWDCPGHAISSSCAEIPTSSGRSAGLTSRIV